MSNNMLNKTQYRQMFWTRLLASPWVMAPLVLGLTDLLALWTFSLNSGPAVFAGLAGILGAVGIATTRLIRHGQAISQEVLAALDRNALKKRKQALDQLEAKLAQDGDPRTENSLRDLRTLVDAFKNEKSWAARLNSRSSFDILSRVEQLFDRSVLSLEKSLALWYTAAQIYTEDAQQPILTQREAMITEVKQSIRQLGLILTEIQTLAMQDPTGNDDLARIRQELEVSLEIAKSVNEQMTHFDQELDELQ